MYKPKKYIYHEMYTNPFLYSFLLVHASAVSDIS